METKKPWESRTNWIGIIIALSALFPQVQAVIAANPELVVQALSAIFIGLRFITKGKIEIK